MQVFFSLLNKRYQSDPFPKPLQGDLGLVMCKGQNIVISLPKRRHACILQSCSIQVVRC
jgi:hypothetical protein